MINAGLEGAVGPQRRDDEHFLGGVGDQFVNVTYELGLEK